MSENTSFAYGRGQEIIVLAWTRGYWRKPNLDEKHCGALPLKGDVCTCGEMVRSDVEKAGDPAGDEEITGALFGEEALF